MKPVKATKGIQLPQPVISGAGKPHLPISFEEINEIKKRSNEPLLFSFRFFDRRHEAFNLGGVDERWFLSFLDVLKDVSGLTRNKLAIEQKDRFRCHPLKWEDVSYKFNFSDDFLTQVECLQFSISKARGRVHGFVIGNRFYIIWLDPHHNLYSKKPKIFDWPKTEYELLQEELEKEKAEKESLWKILDEKTK